MIPILVPAAGASRRMGNRDKLLEEVAEGRPLIHHVAATALAAELGPVLVTLPSLTHPRADALDDLDVLLVRVPDRDEGMSASIRAGIGALPAVLRGVMILPADMPELTARDLRQVAAAFRGDPLPILRGASGSRAGHPVLFPGDLVAELGQLGGDRGAAPVIAAHRDRLQLVPLPDENAVTDLDTPEAWAAWRHLRASSAPRR